MAKQETKRRVAAPGLDWRTDPGFIESVVQSSDALIVVLNAEGRIVFFNRSCERATGYAFEEVAGRLVWRLLIAPEDRKAVRKLFKEIVDRRALRRYENDWLTRGSTRIRVSWSNTVLSDEEGQVAFVVATGAEVTEQRRTEEDLQRANRRAQALFETASQAILAVEGDGRISSANDAATQVFGYQRTELLTMRLEDLMPARFRERHERHRAGFMATPRKRPMGQGLELRALRRSGEEFPIEVGLSHMDAGDGPVAVAFVSDISERAAAQAAADAAGRRVQDLAAKLMTAQEEERRRIARDLHDDFTHRLALLGIELGFLGKEIGQEREDWAARIRNLQEETLALSDEARRLSHELHPAALEHCGIVTALEMQCREFSEGSGVDVALTARDVDDAVAREISSALYRITQEAVRNAVKHAHARRVRVYLTRDAAGTLHLAIADDGRGFDLEKTRSSGTGVGLTSIAERVRQIGGEFEVRSVPGEGSRIEVSVPCLPSTSRE